MIVVVETPSLSPSKKILNSHIEPHITTTFGQNPTFLDNWQQSGIVRNRPSASERRADIGPAIEKPRHS